jgi:hypothetical protein
MSRLADAAQLDRLALRFLDEGQDKSVQRFNAKADAARSDDHRCILRKVRPLAQAVECTLADRKRGRCTAGVDQDRLRRFPRRITIGA